MGFEDEQDQSIKFRGFINKEDEEQVFEETVTYSVFWVFFNGFVNQFAKKAADDEKFMVFRRRWRWRMKRWMAKMVGLRDTTIYV